MDEMRKKVVSWGGIYCEDAVKVFEMTTTDWEYDINLVDKPVAGFERIDPNFERCPTVDKGYQTASHAYRDIVSEKKKPTDAADFIVVLFLVATAPPQPLAATTLNMSSAIHIEIGPSTSKKVTTHWKLR